MSESPLSNENGKEQVKASRSKRGRPKGKKSEPKPVIQSFESVCPTCGKSGAKIRPGNKARHFEVMREVGGVTYTHVRMDTVQCDHCPQAYTRKTYGIK